MQKFLKSLLYVSLACLIGLIVMLFINSSSPLIAFFATGFFISLAIGVRGTDTLFKSFSFSLWIFAAVTFSMFYPQYMTSWGGYNLSNLIVPLIQLIMFGMGTQLSLTDFKRVFEKPKAVGVGLICQYTIMPVIGISIALTFGFPAEVAAGIVLIGSSPGGVASNVMAFIGKADLALSITLTSVSTMLSPILTPYLMQFLAGQFVPIDTFGMMISILNMIIVPIVLGLLFNHFLHGKVKWLDDVMPIVSMAGIAFIIAVITAAGRDALLSIGLLLIFAAIIHNGLGYFLGYWGCRLFGMDEKSCRTIAFEVGMQNAGMASGLAQEMGRLATVGLAPAIFGPWMNISGSALANYWRRKSEKNEAKKSSFFQNEKESWEDFSKDQKENHQSINSPKNLSSAEIYAKTLGLKDEFTISDIKKNYRELSKKYHPDRVDNLGDEFSEIADKKMKDINEAYDWFRKKYDF